MDGTLKTIRVFDARKFSAKLTEKDALKDIDGDYKWMCVVNPIDESIITTGDCDISNFKIENPRNLEYVTSWKWLVKENIPLTDDIHRTTKISVFKWLASRNLLSSLNYVLSLDNNISEAEIYHIIKAACNIKNLEIFKALIDHNHDIGVKNYAGLHLATKANFAPIVKMYLKHEIPKCVLGLSYTYAVANEFTSLANLLNPKHKKKAKKAKKLVYIAPIISNNDDTETQQPIRTRVKVYSNWVSQEGRYD